MSKYKVGDQLVCLPGFTGGDDGSIMINGMGNPYYTYSRSGLIKSIDFSYAQIEPVKYIKKFSLK